MDSKQVAKEIEKQLNDYNSPVNKRYRELLLELRKNLPLATSAEVLNSRMKW